MDEDELLLEDPFLDNIERNINERRKRKVRKSIEEYAQELTTEQLPHPDDEIIIGQGKNDVCSLNSLTSPFCTCPLHQTLSNKRISDLNEIINFKGKEELILEIFEKAIAFKDNSCKLKTLRAVYKSWVDKKSFFNLLKSIAHAAIKYEGLIGKIPYMKENSSITLSKKQCWILLACVLFNYFPDMASFDHILSAGTDISVTKLKMLFIYFTKMAKKQTKGQCVSFLRTTDVEEKDQTGLCYPITDVEVISDGSRVEDCSNMLIVNFANCSIGGGVLRNGCAQEELLFCKFPEMFLTILLNAKAPFLANNEVLKVIGIEAFSDYEKYGSKATAKHAMKIQSMAKVDERGRLFSEIVFMDATQFDSKNSTREFTSDCIEREYEKANLAFKQEYGVAKPVSTGYWGCGVFHGNRELKAIIQIIAASNNKRKIVFHSMGNENFKLELDTIVEVLKKKGTTTFELMKLLKEVSQQEKATSAVFDNILINLLSDKTYE